MKYTSLSSTLACSALLVLATPVAFAQHDHHDSKPADKAAAATDKSAYPLDTCVVSGDKLGEMGAPVEYVHREPGKPDRLVLFCCKDCAKDFKKDPAKYLKKIDEAAAAKAHAAGAHQP